MFWAPFVSPAISVTKLKYTPTQWIQTPIVFPCQQNKFYCFSLWWSHGLLNWSSGGSEWYRSRTGEQWTGIRVPLLTPDVSNQPYWFSWKHLKVMTLTFTETVLKSVDHYKQFLRNYSFFFFRFLAQAFHILLNNPRAISPYYTRKAILHFLTMIFKGLR